MLIFKSLDEIDESVGRISAMGSFDGVHAGHRIILKKLAEESRKRGLSQLAITFNPNPKVALGKTSGVLSSCEEQLILLEEAGVENVLLLPFSDELRKTSPSAFLKILKTRINVQACVMSSDHFFGNEAAGNKLDLIEAGIDVISVDMVMGISSTKIRELILLGQISKATELLSAGYLIKTPLTDPYKILPPADRLYDAIVNGDKTKVDMKFLPDNSLIRLC